MFIQSLERFYQISATRIAVLLLALAFIALPEGGIAGDAGERLTNADVVKMVQAKLAPNVIISQINNSVQNFDLSTNSVIALKEAGVPDEVLAAMLVSSARAPSVSVPSLPGTPPSLVSGGSGMPAPLSPPGLPVSGAPGFSGMDSLELPPLSARDPLGGGLPGLPSLPALSALPPVPGVSGLDEGVPVAPPQALTPPNPVAGIEAPAPVQAQTPAFSLPPIENVGVGSDFYSYDPPSSSAEAGSVSGTGERASAPAAKTADDVRYEEVKERYQKELANIMSEAPGKQTAAVAWMVANQQCTLDFLRETMVKAPRPEFEAAAVYALGRMRDAEAVQEIRRRLVSGNGAVRQRAADALAYMEDNDAIAAAEKGLTQRVEPMDGLIRLVGYARLVRASENLGKILSDNSVPANRIAAAWALAQLGRAGTAAWPAMKKAMTSDSNPDVRREAARAVSRYHDDQESLKLLETACRRDPEVRKVVLEELENYRDSIPFLISVINLSADQIALDESETARSTLFKLTGEDFNLDGPRWKKWLADNRGRLGFPVPFGESSGDGTLPAGMKKGPAHLAAGRPRQVDVRSWGIVADPAEIPLAPEVDDTPGGRATLGAAQGGRLPVPPPGFAGGPAGLSGPSSGGFGGASREDVGGGFGGGMPGGIPGMGGAGLPPPGGIAGRFDDDDFGPPGGGMGGGALPGMRLPLPSGMLGAGGDDAPPIPVGRGAGSASGSFGGGGMGMGGLGGIGGGASGMSSMPESGLSGMPIGEGAREMNMPETTYSSGGYDSGFPPSSPASSYETMTSYGDSGSGYYESGVGGYGSSVETYHEPIVLPPTEYAPLSLDAYIKTDVIGDEVSQAGERNESTGDLMPNVPYDRVTTLEDLGIGDWESSISISEVADETQRLSGAVAEAMEVGVADEGGVPFELMPPSGGSGSVSAAAVVAAPRPASPPPAAFSPAPETDNVIAFPDDQTTFGLGEPMFNEYGQPTDAEAMELPMRSATGSVAVGEALPPVAPLQLPPAMQQQVQSAVQEYFPPQQATGAVEGGVPIQGGMTLSLPREAMEAMGGGMPEMVQGGFDAFDGVGSRQESGQFVGGGDFDYEYEGVDSGAAAFETTQAYETEAYETEAYEVDPFAGAVSEETARGYGRVEMSGQDGFEDEYRTASASEYDEGFDEYDDDDEYEDFAGEVEAREMPEGYLTGGGEPEDTSPSAASLRLPAGRQRKRATESVRVTGPFKILDEDGRTEAIVMNGGEDVMVPRRSESEYIEMDEGLGSGEQTVEAREVPVVRGGGIQVETSPSQRPGRNFRQKK